MKDFKSAWKSDSEEKKKPWGSEIIWSPMTNGIHGKILYIDGGKRTSFKYFPRKDETLFMLSGAAQIYHGDEGSLKDEVNHPFTTEPFMPGDVLHVQSGCPYRIIALEDCQIIEIGKHTNDDPVRIEDDFGRAGEGQ